MTHIHKKIVVDENGTPKEAIIPWEEFQLIEEMLGLDLDERACEQLDQATSDILNGHTDAFVSLDDLA